MRVIVTGSRGWTNREIITDRLSLLPGGGTTVIVVGYNEEKDSPPGVDRIAFHEAQALGHGVEPHPADWDRFGQRAGIVRNIEMADSGADLCIAFWDGVSTGTAHMMSAAKSRGIPVEIVGMPRE